MSDPSSSLPAEAPRETPAEAVQRLIALGDMRIQIVQREINQGALAGLGSEISEYAAALVVAALDSFDSHAQRRDLDADPEALAWARAKVEKVRDKYRGFEAHAREEGSPERAAQWRKFTIALNRDFIGGKGCVIASFDERLPDFAAALEMSISVDELAEREKGMTDA